MTRWLVLRLLLLALPAAALASPAEDELTLARQQLAIHPTAATSHIAVALACLHRERETGAPRWADRALASADHALTLEPRNFEAARARAQALLARHEYANVLALATDLNQRNPDDLPTYAVLFDAQFALGHYTDAEKTAQWLLDLRPDNILGLTRAAALREVYGDLDGALQLLNDALLRTSPSAPDEQAELFTRIAALRLQAGQLELAEAPLTQALTSLPGYGPALRQLAALREAQTRDEEALKIYHALLDARPDPEAQLALARTLSRLGRATDAAREFSSFKAAALAVTHAADNANRALVDYLAEEGREPAAALALAQGEFVLRQDLATRSALAWAWYRNGDAANAWRAASALLALGSQQPEILYRAGLIASAVGETSRAEMLLHRALTLAPQHALATRALGAGSAKPIASTQ